MITERAVLYASLAMNTGGLEVVVVNKDVEATRDG
jgi:hypothetical protein